MEIMYCDKYNDIFDNNSIIGIYGDKVDLINYGVEFNGIIYNDEWTVRRFLNGYKLKIDEVILDIFNDLEINYRLLKKRLKELSKSQFKLILLVSVLLNKKNIIVLDYFDKGLSFKVKKRVINYLKTKYNGTIIVISNDIVFLNLISKKIVIFKDGNIIFDDEFSKLYKSKIKIDYPEIIKFIKLANKKKAKLSYTVDSKELLKDIYRSVK